MFLLGIGSNLSSKYGDRFQNIEKAIYFLEYYKVKILKKSSYYETPSYPDKNFPKFINVVIKIETNLSIDELASTIILVEKKLERKRIRKNEPRTCDIDILDFNGRVMEFNYNNSKFIVPRKGLTYRNFVLFPLEEIVPNWIHPETKVKISELIGKLSEEDRKSILKIKKN